VDGDGSDISVEIVVDRSGQSVSSVSVLAGDDGGEADVLLGSRGLSDFLVGSEGGEEGVGVVEQDSAQSRSTVTD